MIKAGSTGDLRPLPWTLVPITPLPEVIFDDSPEAWLRWDAAKASQELNSPDQESK